MRAEACEGLGPPVRDSQSSVHGGRPLKELFRDRLTRKLWKGDEGSLGYGLGTVVRCEAGEMGRHEAGMITSQMI